MRCACAICWTRLAGRGALSRVKRALTWTRAIKVSQETRNTLPQIRWGDIIGMRNRVIHNYANVDYNIV